MVLADIDRNEDTVNSTSVPPSQADLAILSQVVREVTRSRRLSAADAQDFAQNVQLRLVERNYDLFQRFTGRSSLRTYLTVAITRMLLDWLNSTYGKWRPCAAAVRMGAHAIRLDRLVDREGYTLDQALEMMRADRDVPSETELRRMADQLPRRPHRRMVSDEVLESMSMMTFDDPVEAAEDRSARGRIHEALSAALRQLTPEERKLIQLRYQQKLSVRTLADVLSVEPKTLYRRFDRTLQALRRSLLAAGVRSSTCLDSGGTLAQ
jgi:RNA polymerase sigma factor (sigma-70 family)